MDSLINFTNLFSLEQHNNISNAFNNTPDLVFVNFQCEVSKELLLLVPEDDYHPALSISLSLTQTNDHTFPVNLALCRYNFRKANFPQLYDMILNAGWSDIYSTPDVNQACDFFDKCVPKSIIHKRNFQIWFTSDIIKINKTETQNI